MNYSIYSNARVSTSGSRFFLSLSEILKKKYNFVDYNKYTNEVLFNISVPILLIFQAKLKRQKIILRVDGLYFDLYDYKTCNLVPSKKWQKVLVLFTYFIRPITLSHIANFVDQNYKSFFRIMLADYIIYQSNYSKNVHQKYFKKKKYLVITNGSVYKNENTLNYVQDKNNITLGIIYDSWRPSKRITDLILWVKWANEKKNEKIQLYIFGYNGIVPRCAPSDLKDIIEKSKFIYHYSRFVKIEEIGGLLSTLDMYLTFSYRDACPNAVIEAMSYGLPIVGFDSGGIKDIVKNAGEVMSFNDTFDHFGPGRFNNNFPDIDKENVLTTVKRVKKNIIHYKKLVEKRFDDDLDMNLIAKKYYQCIDSLGSS